jgi:phytoene dehydrogenase-like protein
VSVINPLNKKATLAVREVREQAIAMEMSSSFMHLYLGIPSDGLPDDLDCHHLVLNLKEDIMGEHKLIIVSIPMVFNSTLAPAGYHVVHTYTAASKYFANWEHKLEKGYDKARPRKPITGGASHTGT